MLEVVRSEGLLRRGRPVVVLLSGGRDSTCLLDLAVEIVGADAVAVLHVNYGLRPEAAEADERHCRELAAGFGVPLEVHRPSRPQTGNVQAWARETRYEKARELAAAARCRDRGRPHRDRPGRDDPLPARVLAEPAGAARHAPARRGPHQAAAQVHARGDGGALRGQGSQLARGREQYV